MCEADRSVWCRFRPLGGWAVIWLVAIALPVAPACSGEPAPGADIAAAIDAAAIDAATNDASEDGAAGDALLPSDASSDASSDAAPECPGAGGCPCTSNAACDIGLCIPTPAGRQCARACVDSCPAGFLCAPAPSSGGGDAITVCIPEHGLMCDPCVSDIDCAVPGLAGTGCLAYDHSERFCAGPCGAAGACPEGSTCEATTTVEGDVGTFCVRAAPVDGSPTCPCTQHAVEEQLTTACDVDKLSGEGELTERCKGIRLCDLDGTPSCSEITGAGALCIDTQCIIAGTVAKKDGTACDDGDACTANEKCLAGQCSGGADVCACEIDAECLGRGGANPCDGTLYCNPQTHQCESDPGTVVTCSEDDDPCTTVACDPQIGACQAKLVAVGTACQPADACFQYACDAAGACVAEQTCACATSADCAALEDGDPCNGTLFCDATSHSCKVNPATLVVCADDGNACTKAVCVAGAGVCAAAPLPVTVTCATDDDPCTQQSCDGQGACGATLDLCDCQVHADCAPSEDGDLCNGSLFCDKSAFPYECAVNPATVVSCPAVTASSCSQAVCQPATGACKVIGVADKSACEDGNACTEGDHCVNGACASGASVCACGGDADCAAKEDGDACNGTLFCNLTNGHCTANPATVVTCPTAADDACVTNGCDPDDGACKMTPVAKLIACDDGDPCTAGETCDGDGSCAASELANTCTCTDDADCMDNEDGDVCNGVLFCNKQMGACQLNPATVISCPTVDDSGCRHNVCLAKEGTCAMADSAPGSACDDGEPCTANDSCDGQGACVAGVTVVCPCQGDADCANVDDGNLCNGTWYCDKGGKQPQCKWNPSTAIVCPQGNTCLDYACDAETGECAPTAIGEGDACDDDDACTPYAQCADKLCVGDGLVDCDDGNACTDDVCEAKPGCVALPNAATCSDGDACTSADACGDGSCAAGAALECDDGNACTDDACAAGSCAHAFNEAPCDDGDVCTAPDACASGGCEGAAKACEDGNPCTDDACEAGKGCGHVTKNCDDGNLCTDGLCDGGSGDCKQVPSGASCDDGDVCTTGDSCGGGVCMAGAPTACDDDVACTADSCGALTGCQHLDSQDGTTCDDGKVCTIADTCVGGACSGITKCDDGQPCTDDVCDKIVGCLHADNEAVCDDGNVCTAGDKCAGGACAGGVQNTCDDGEPCTDDFCAGDCKHFNNSDDCDDGSACTAGEACKSGTCQGGVSLACDDEIACTVDSCDAEEGCLFATDAAKCDDGADCTDDSCDGELGCQHAPNKAACSDGNACTTGDLCGSGTCLPGSVTPCDDGVPCTDNGCDPATGCVFPGASAGTPCGVGKSCDGQSACVASCGDSICIWPENCALCPGDCCAVGAKCGDQMVAVDVDGSVYCAPEYPAWGVRPESPPASWFTDNGDGTVSDSQSNLMWQKEDSSGANTWPDAIAYCQGLVLAGHTDWRIPSRFELETLMDFSTEKPSLPVVLGGQKTEHHWTAAALTGGVSYAWFVDFYDGKIDYSYKTDNKRVICVR